MMTASFKSSGSLPCSQQQVRSSCSLVCNDGPPCFQISAGIPSTPAALPVFIWWIASQVSTSVGALSRSMSTGCCGILMNAVSWTLRSAVKRALKCSVHLFRMEALSVWSVSSTFDMVKLDDLPGRVLYIIVGNTSFEWPSTCKKFFPSGIQRRQPQKCVPYCYSWAMWASMNYE